MKHYFFFLITIFCFSAVHGQIAQAPGITLDQSVIAGGGGTSTGGEFSVTGTIGEGPAGTTSTGGELNLSDGFWQGLNIRPTAANVSVAGRVTNSANESIAQARVVFTGSDGIAHRWTSNNFGYYMIDGLVAGQTYIVTITARQYTFVPVAVSVNDNMSGFTLMMY